MQLKFDQLSDILLGEIFKSVHPEELVDLCFLSKDLFNITSRVVKYNSTYSLYNQPGFTKYRSYQESFFKENGKLIRHINIDCENFEYLNYCPNVQSICYSNKDCTSDDNCITHNDIKLTIEMPKLTKLTIIIGYYLLPLNQFDKYLKQIEVFEYKRNEISIENVIKDLNPNKLKSLTLKSHDSLYLNGLDILKMKFFNLKMLKLTAYDFHYKFDEINLNLNFKSDLELEIKCKYEFDRNEYEYCVNCFGDLKQLKGIKLLNYIDLFQTIGSDSSDLSLIENSNVVALGTFDPNQPINYDFLKLSALKEVCIESLSNELLSAISLLPRIQTINLSGLNQYARLFNNSKFNKNEFYKEYNIIKSKYIKRIQIKNFEVTVEEFVHLISLFPNLGMIKVPDFILNNQSVEINYKHTTSLLLITPLTNYNEDVFNVLLRHIPSLYWIKL